MLSLSRRNDQSLVITTPDGVKIEVTLTDARRGRARIAIHAPLDYRIDRAEVLEREQQDDSVGNS